MSGSDFPEQWQDLLAGYALGDLDTEEAEALQQLLAASPEIAAALQSYQECLNLLPYALELQPPPLELEEAILTAAKADAFPEGTAAEPIPGGIRSELQFPPAIHRPPNPMPRPLMGRLQLAVAAIALVCMTVLGLDYWQLRQQRAEAQRLRQQLQLAQNLVQQLQAERQTTRTVLAALQQPRTLIYTLVSAEPATPASANLVTVPGHRQMVLIASGLPTLPTAKVYRLWAVTRKAAKPTYCGQFNPLPDRPTRWLAADPICVANPVQMLVTVNGVADAITSAGPLILHSRI